MASMSSEPQAIVEASRTLLLDMAISRYFIVAGFTILIYDHFLTFSDEVRLVWKRRRNVVSWVFLVNRYFTPGMLALDLYDKLGFTTNLTLSHGAHQALYFAMILCLPAFYSCRTWVIGDVGLHLLSQAAIHGLVAIRVNALWGNRPNLRIFLLIAWTIYFVATMGIAMVAVFQERETFIPDPIVHSCVGEVGTFVWTVWISPLFLEGILFGMTVFKLARHRQRWVATVPLMYVLYRDGFIYFVIIALCSVFNLVVWKSFPPTMFALAKYFTLGLVNTLGSRMVLNLREQGAVETNDPPPANFHFIDTRISYSPRDIEDRHFPMLESRAHQLFEEPGWHELQRPAPAKPPKAKPRDPYFYERRANTLRHLKAKVGRSGTSHSSRSTKTVKTRPRHNLSAIYADQPSGSLTPRTWSDINSTASIPVSQVGTEDGETYDMELLPIPVSTAGRRGDVGRRLRPGFQRLDTDNQQGPSGRDNSV
ncbi:hypothetical protein FRB96_005226 [Tulasnella sp. 330]|nr:hypothetical protein FRB96_005226 [Tulasnella sp. 330]